MSVISTLITLVITITMSQVSNSWPNHDISTLKLLQVVHRHGDRTALDLPPNDPFKNESYWPEGIGKLTKRGRDRMYKVGQFIREEYGLYLGEKYSPLEVYARSSASDRCLESAALLLAGAYPPKQKAVQWSDSGLGLVWQPIPIQSFIPRIDDTVLEEDKPCKAEDEEMAKIFNRTEVQKFIADNKDFFANLSMITGADVQFTTWAADYLYDALSLETERGLYWDSVWTKEEEHDIIDRLFAAIELEFRISWDSAVQQRLLGGGLVKELNTNLKKVVDKANDKRLYTYSTHDSLVAVLMESFGVYNDIRPPYGATLLLELHHKSDSSSSTQTDTNYFLRVFYLNVTESGVPHSLRWGLNDCQTRTDCPYDLYLNSTQHLIYDNFDEECDRV